MTEELTMTQKVQEYADENEATMLLCDPQDLYNDAILGVFDDENGPRVVYSKQKMVEALAAAFALHPPENTKHVHDAESCTDECDLEFDEGSDDPEQDAIDFLEFNTFNACVGPEGPIYIDDLSDRF